MSWLQWYRFRTYFQSSIWIPPVIGIIVSQIAFRVIIRLDRAYDLAMHTDPGATRDLLATLASSMFTLIVFVSSALLLAVQLASAQLTPRVISLLFKDLVTKIALTLFVFTFTFALSVAVRIKEDIPLVAVRVAGYSSLVSLAFFLYLIDHVGKFLRPSGVLRVVFTIGRGVIRQIYPRQFGATAVTPQAAVPRAEPTQTIGSSRGGVVLALDVKGLVALAERLDCFIEMLPQVGDFVAAEEPLFRVYGGGGGLSASALHDSVAVGSERTLEQDPTFAFRIMVDIAAKGLSPAINDPTTAVLAIDQIHRLLRMVGLRDLDEGHVRDSAGRLRLIYPTPDWEDFVHLAVTEIRQFGATSVQIPKRLRAMLENLIQTLPPERVDLLRQEMSRLQRSAERSFPDAEDQALAKIGDSQGIGGKRGETQARHVGPLP